MRRALPSVTVEQLIAAFNTGAADVVRFAVRHMSRAERQALRDPLLQRAGELIGTGWGHAELARQVTDRCVAMAREPEVAIDLASVSGLLRAARVVNLGAAPSFSTVWRALEPTFHSDAAVNG